MSGFGATGLKVAALWAVRPQPPSQRYGNHGDVSTAVTDKGGYHARRVQAWIRLLVRLGCSFGVSGISGAWATCEKLIPRRVGETRVVDLTKGPFLSRVSKYRRSPMRSRDGT